VLLTDRANFVSVKICATCNEKMADVQLVAAFSVMSLKLGSDVTSSLYHAAEGRQLWIRRDFGSRSSQRKALTVQSVLMPKIIHKNKTRNIKTKTNQMTK